MGLCLGTQGTKAGNARYQGLSVMPKEVMILQVSIADGDEISRLVALHNTEFNQ